MKVLRISQDNELDAAVKEGDNQVLAEAIRIGNYQTDEIPETVASCFLYVSIQVSRLRL